MRVRITITEQEKFRVKKKRNRERERKIEREGERKAFSYQFKKIYYSPSEHLWEHFKPHSIQKHIKNNETKADMESIVQMG